MCKFLYKKLMEDHSINLSAIEEKQKKIAWKFKFSANLVLVFPSAGPKFFMISLVAAIVYILESPLHQVFFVVDSVTSQVRKLKLKYNEISDIT